MSVSYRGIQWNAQKRRYDAVLAAGLAGGAVAWVAASLIARPELTVETLVIRGSALAAFALLHLILCIGPLCRLDRRFLPLLYNRRHLGVTMFLLALLHAVFCVVQFHALGDANPLVSVFTAYRSDYVSFARQAANLAHFPFEPLGAAALAILFLMAATSHDFWLRQLGPGPWKALHLLVLAAYALLVGHVVYGVLQSERSPVYVGLLCGGAAAVLGLHGAAALREGRQDRRSRAAAAAGWARACDVSDLRPDRGIAVHVGGERVALFWTAGRVFALSNVCRHQGGPLGEGRILDGCITCPWHGWQYRPDSGTSPPPFTERVETRGVRVQDGAVWVRAEADPAGTSQEGARVP